ncbi:MAG TPA: hypothetical protein VK814_00690 [Acidobacteriaceae bacterium]|jgi:hypothetical protein|nr:hypothetical protein [Acidobacteriaceae bacterium]
MMRVRWCVRGWVWGVLLAVGAVGGGAVGVAAQQQDERAPAESVAGELRLLGSRAGVVFVGQVRKIESKDGTGGGTDSGVVEITFSVEQPVLGVVGGSYVMREWAGRWTGGQQHLQAGQRAMFFLYAPGASGLSSAVDGMMGAVPVVPMGANGAALLDVRWLATRVRRAAGASLAGVTGISQGGIALADGVAVTRDWKTGGLAEPKGVRLPEGWVQQEASPTQQGMRVGQKVGAVWMKEADDARR